MRVPVRLAALAALASAWALAPARAEPDCPTGLDRLAWGVPPSQGSPLVWVYLSTTHERDFSEIEDALTWPKLSSEARCAAWKEAAPKADDMEALLVSLEDLAAEAEANAARKDDKLSASQLADFARLARERRERLGSAVVMAADAAAERIGLAGLERIERVVERLRKAMVREPEAKDALRILEAARRPLRDPFERPFEEGEEGVAVRDRRVAPGPSPEEQARKLAARKGKVAGVEKPIERDAVDHALDFAGPTVMAGGAGCALAVPGCQAAGAVAFAAGAAATGLNHAFHDELAEALRPAASGEGASALDDVVLKAAAAGGAQWAKEELWLREYSEKAAKDPNVGKVSPGEAKDEDGRTRQGVWLDYKDGSRLFRDPYGLRRFVSVDDHEERLEDPARGLSVRIVDGVERARSLELPGGKGTYVESRDGPRTRRLAVLDAKVLGKELSEGRSDLSFLPVAALPSATRTAFERFLKAYPERVPAFKEGFADRLASAEIRDGKLRLGFLPEPGGPTRTVIVEPTGGGGSQAWLFSGSSASLDRFDADFKTHSVLVPEDDRVSPDEARFRELARYRLEDGGWKLKARDLLEEGPAVSLSTSTLDWALDSLYRGAGNVAWGAGKVVGAAGAAVGAGYSLVSAPVQSVFYEIEGAVFEGAGAWKEWVSEDEVFQGEARIKGGFFKLHGHYTRNQAKLKEWFGVSAGELATVPGAARAAGHLFTGPKADSDERLLSLYQEGLQGLEPDQRQWVELYLDQQVRKLRGAESGVFAKLREDEPVSELERARAAGVQFGLASLPGVAARSAREAYLQGNYSEAAFQAGLGGAMVFGQSAVEGAAFGLASAGARGVVAPRLAAKYGEEEAARLLARWETVDDVLDYHDLASIPAAAWQAGGETLAGRHGEAADAALQAWYGAAGFAGTVAGGRGVAALTKAAVEGRESGLPETRPVEPGRAPSEAAAALPPDPPVGDAVALQGWVRARDESRRNEQHRLMRLTLGEDYGLSRFGEAEGLARESQKLLDHEVRLRRHFPKALEGWDSARERIELAETRLSRAEAELLKAASSGEDAGPAREMLKAREAEHAFAIEELERARASAKAVARHARRGAERVSNSRNADQAYDALLETHQGKLLGRLKGKVTRSEAERAADGIVSAFLRGKNFEDVPSYGMARLERVAKVEKAAEGLRKRIVSELEPRPDGSVERDGAERARLEALLGAAGGHASGAEAARQYKAIRSRRVESEDGAEALYDEKGRRLEVKELLAKTYGESRNPRQEEGTCAAEAATCVGEAAALAVGRGRLDKERIYLAGRQDPDSVREEDALAVLEAYAKEGPAEGVSRRVMDEAARQVGMEAFELDLADAVPYMQKTGLPLYYAMRVSESVHHAVALRDPRVVVVDGKERVAFTVIDSNDERGTQRLIFMDEAAGARSEDLFGLRPRQAAPAPAPAPRAGPAPGAVFQEDALKATRVFDVPDPEKPKTGVKPETWRPEERGWLGSLRHLFRGAPAEPTWISQGRVAYMVESLPIWLEDSGLQSALEGVRRKYAPGVDAAAFKARVESAIRKARVEVAPSDHPEFEGGNNPAAGLVFRNGDPARPVILFNAKFLEDVHEVRTVDMMSTYFHELLHYEFKLGEHGAHEGQSVLRKFILKELESKGLHADFVPLRERSEPARSLEGLDSLMTAVESDPVGGLSDHVLARYDLEYLLRLPDDRKALLDRFERRTDDARALLEAVESRLQLARLGRTPPSQADLGRLSARARSEYDRLMDEAGKGSEVERYESMRDGAVRALEAAERDHRRLRAAAERIPLAPRPGLRSAR